MSTTLKITGARTERESKAAAALVGRTIDMVEVGPDGEPILFLSGGLQVVVMRDPEGNGPGSLHIAGPGPGDPFRVVGGE